jgi:hypothetical protein
LTVIIYKLVSCRFFGSTSVTAVFGAYNAAQRVGFTTKLTAVLGQAAALYALLDAQLGLTGQFAGLVEKMYSVFSLVLSRQDCCDVGM